MEIAILAGGNSSEFEISIKSGEQILQWLEKGGYSSYLVIVKNNTWTVQAGKRKYKLDKESFSFKKDKKIIRFDYAWNTIHGTPGENGILQGFLDMIQIPFNCSGLLPAAMTFNKHVAKNYLKPYGIMTAESILIRKDISYNIEEITDKVGLPCFIKPNNGGSSFGTSKVTQVSNMKAAIIDAFMEDEEVMVESYLKGTEVTCGLYKTKENEVIFPLTEIVSKTDFFDYKAKYEGYSDEITPARIDDDLVKRCQQIASDIYDLLHCKGLVRVDFIIKGNQAYFLEMNTVPGMSAESIIPQQIRAAGMKVEDVLREIIEDSTY